MAAAVQGLAIEAERHRFTFRHTRRTVLMAFSMMLVQASERRSSFGNPSRVTVRISSMPSRIEPATPDHSRSRRWARLKQPFGLGGVVQLPCLSQHAANRGMQRLGQSLHDVASLVNLTALDRCGTAEGSADRLRQGLGAVNDE